ncbi:MAG TPA: hypothetical protein VF503_08355 [Sphingobium sp.]|uniref:hypothetical protein n=1 Tax=Sphingobium sp. TaxID=1912891 RepID=UPI002ED11830
MTQVDRRTFLRDTSALGAAAAALASPAAAGLTGVPVPTYSDPLFNQPYIDVDEWRETPSRHRYVHGGFKGTEARFLLHLPPKEQYQGRFFQHNTAIPTSELQAGAIFGNSFESFCFDSGAIAVVTNQGGFTNIAQVGSDAIDPAIGSYRVAAATAMYVRTLAAQMYGPHRTYGYAFGGSGGAYRTLACAENTDAWEGVVPFIHGNAHAWPNSYAGRARAQRVLKAKMAHIADAIEPGGGDIHAGLTPAERDVLDEVTKLGFPVRTWVFNEAMGIGPLTVLFQGIQTLDPEYFELFWKTPGYLGHDDPAAFTDVRVQHRVKVKRVILSSEAAAAGLQAPRGKGTDADPDLAWRTFQADYGAPLPVAIELEAMPPSGSFLDMANINILSGPSAGKWIVLGGLKNNIATFQFSPAGGSLRDITDRIRPGDEVQIDNSNILAYETYYRHALLTPDYYVDNQFRKADGTPLYPQRPKLIAFELMKGATPTLPVGKFGCKMIVVQNLTDWDAHAWYADHYRSKVRQNLGARFEDRYRLYYTDHATHGPMPDPTRVIDFSGVLQQALRDLAAWVEKGVTPPGETSYRVDNGQVVVAPTAATRKGLQPVVTLRANGGVRAEVKAGEPVTFTAVIETPPGCGSVVSAEWAFETGPEVSDIRDNRFTVSEKIVPGSHVTLSRSHVFTKPGTYFPALLTHAQRKEAIKSGFARVANLGRVRVVVT